MRPNNPPYHTRYKWGVHLGGGLAMLGTASRIGSVHNLAQGAKELPCHLAKGATG